MRKSLNKPWTAEEDQRLRELIDKGLPVARIAVALKRSRSGTYNRVHTLGLAAAKPEKATPK